MHTMLEIEAATSEWIAYAADVPGSVARLGPSIPFYERLPLRHLPASEENAACRFMRE